MHLLIFFKCSKFNADSKNAIWQYADHEQINVSSKTFQIKFVAANFSMTIKIGFFSVWLVTYILETFKNLTRS